MKKIMMMFLALIILLSTKDVFAQQEYHLTLEKQDGIYMTREGESYGYDSYPFYIYKMDNMFAYCIEPGKHITTYTYTGEEDYVDLGFSEELKEKLELIGYYGREYPGHNNVRYSMAAQALIWELTGVDKVSFWTKQYEQGDEIDITNERNEIMNLVNNHKTLPNLNNSYSGYLKKELVINDTNKVLNNYKIESSDNIDVYIDNNTLHITPSKVGSFNIKLKRKSYDEYNTIIFVGKGNNSSQKLGRLHFNKEIKKELTINVEGIRLVIHKVDENNQPIKLSNIKFSIKNKSTGEYLCNGSSNCIYKTNNDGIIITEPLDYGEYEVEELENQITQGYTWNSEKLTIKIDDNTIFNWDNEKHNYIDLSFTNHSVAISIEINKTGEIAIFDNNTISYRHDKLSNITFDLYTIDDQYVGSGTTNSNGIAMINNLKVGKYYLIERTKLNNYIEKDKYNLTIRQISQYQNTIVYHLNFENELKKGKLEFNKVDSNTYIGIPNTIIEIYNDQDVLLFTKETDDNGKVIIENLPGGKYYIKEKTANYFYERSDEKIEFEIKENNEVIKKTMANKKIVGDLEINKVSENYHFINNEIIYEKESLHAIEFDIYDNKDNLIGSIKTDNNGYAKYTNLTLGKYYLKEKTCLDKYICNDRIDFEIVKDSNDKAIDVKLEIVNYLKKGNLEFSKIDYVTSEGIPNTIIEVYNDKDMLLFTKKTDSEGKVVIDKLPFGKYYIIEKEASYYYEKTDEKVFFEIKENGSIVKANMKNKKILGNLEIEKCGEKYQIKDEKMVYEEITLPNIEFDLYDEANNLIDTIITDTNGYAKYSNLPLGKYYLIEKNKLDNYISNIDKIYFEIKKDNEKAIDVKLKIENYLKKGNLLFSKIDLTTSEGIPNTIIEIYDENNNLWFTRETDEFGQIIINDLPIGKYYIIEKEANSLYMLTNEKVFFEIKENGEIVKAIMTNEKIEVEVPKTKTKESILLNIIVGLSSLIGIGRMHYERKKTN